MKADELYRELSLFTRLTAKRSPTASYRALAFAPDHVRAIGLFGQMERDISLGLDTEICINCEDILQLLRSLPDAEFAAHQADGALRWTCGPAKGHLALMTDEGSRVVVPALRFADELAAPEGDVYATRFADGLALGSLACGSTALRALGLLGVQLDNIDGRSYARATDAITFSSCCLGPALDGPPPGVITLLPEAVELLGALVRRDGEALVTYDASSLFCVTESARLLLHQVPPLRTDVSDILGRYDSAEMTMPLYREAIVAFIKRAEALSEAPGGAMVEVAADNGRTRLAFSEAGSSSEEYYLVEGGPKITVPPVRIEAHRLTKALAHADELVFDYASQNVLILRGPDEFIFGVTARREP